MSQEERSELYTEPISDISSEETETAEVNTKDSDNYAWDNYREDPSFVVLCYAHTHIKFYHW